MPITRDRLGRFASSGGGGSASKGKVKSKTKGGHFPAGTTMNVDHKGNMSIKKPGDKRSLKQVLKDAGAKPGKGAKIEKHHTPIGLKSRFSATNKPPKAKAAAAKAVGVATRFTKENHPANQNKHTPIGIGSRFSKDNKPPAAKKAASRAVGVATRFNSMTNPPPKKSAEKTAILKSVLAKIRANKKSKTKI